MSEDNSQNEALRALAKKAGISIGTFLAGGVIAFAYSYAPLHDAKDWKIEYLEDRARIEGEELRKARVQLAAAQAEAQSRPDGDTFKMLQEELAGTDQTIASLEKQLDRAKRRIKELERSRNNWKKKVAAAETRNQALAKEIEGLAAAPASEPGGTATVPDDTLPAPGPAAPAPVGAPEQAEPAPVTPPLDAAS